MFNLIHVLFNNSTEVVKAVADTTTLVSGSINVDSTVEVVKEVIASISNSAFFGFICNVKFVIPIIAGICLAVQGLKSWIKWIKSYITIIVAIVISMIVAFIVGHFNNFSVIQSLTFGGVSAAIASGCKDIIKSFLKVLANK
jgi:hypothetical protein